MAHNKIHATSSTGLSLNERFTAMAERTAELRRQRSRSRSRSRSLVRELQPVNAANTQANRRLLLQLERRHKMLAAMRVKRKSLRPSIGAGYLKRGSIKATRVAANGRPIKANSLTRVATMKADLIAGAGRRAGGRPLRRFESASNIGQRLGVNRAIGGAAERIERRRLARIRAEILRNANSFNAGRNGSIGGAASNRRGRSRSRTRLTANNSNNIKAGISAAMNRGRSRSRSRNRLQSNGGRSQSRNRIRQLNNNNGGGSARNNSNLQQRGRSMSRNRDNYGNLPVKERLGVRPGANGRSNSNVGNRQRRNNSVNRRNNSVNSRNQKVIRGRVDKRRVGGGGRALNTQRSSGTGGRVAPARGRSRSRTRKGQQQQDRQRLQGNRVNSNNRQAVGRRGRSRQRGFNNNNNNNGSNNNNNYNGNNNNRKGNVRKNGQQQQQPRRGRSRSRRGGRNLGAQNSKQQNVKKEDLDKELDQYMATTRNENDLDFLLKN